jgi:hypothetical protein
MLMIDKSDFSCNVCDPLQSIVYKKYIFTLLFCSTNLVTPS